MKRDKLGRFLKGKHYSVATQFKKGQCGGEKSLQWKGGRRKTTNGYIMVNMPNHPRAYRNEVYEHIVVAEKKLGRYLVKGECVHHINGIKDDNREENIITFPSNGKHIETHCKYIKLPQKPFPLPKQIGDRIRLMTNKRMYEVKKCTRCGKLFWSWGYRPKTLYCSHSCGTLGGRYGK